MMNKFKITLFYMIFMSTHSLAGNLGLTQEVVTRYLRYSFQPEHRQVFTSLGHREKFLEQNIEFLRDRVTPMLGEFSQIHTTNKKNQIPLLDYDPKLKVESIDDKTLKNLNKFTYPANLKWKSRQSTSRGTEFIEISFSKAPEEFQFMNLVSSYETIFAKNLKRESFDSDKSKKMKLTKAEKEMLEPIRRKKIVLHKYHKYYGVYYRFDGLVEGSYATEFNELLKAEFTDIQQKFKYIFGRDQEVNMAINAKLILDLEENIEDSNFKDLTLPFTMHENKLPKRYVRISKETENSEMIFLIARKDDSKNVLPILTKILNQL